MRSVVTAAGKAARGGKSPKAKEANEDQSKLLDVLQKALDKAGFDVERYDDVCEVPGQILFFPDRRYGLNCDALSEEITEIEDDIQDQLDELGENTRKTAMGYVARIVELMKEANDDKNAPDIKDGTYVVEGVFGTGKRKRSVIAIIRGRETFFTTKFGGFNHVDTKQFLKSWKNIRFTDATKEPDYAITSLSDSIVKVLYR